MRSDVLPYGCTVRRMAVGVPNVQFSRYRISIFEVLDA